MSVRGLTTRLNKFIGPRLLDPDGCDGPRRVVAVVDAGESWDGTLPDDMPRCPKCGGRHPLVLEITEVVEPGYPPPDRSPS